MPAIAQAHECHAAKDSGHSYRENRLYHILLSLTSVCLFWCAGSAMNQDGRSSGLTGDEVLLLMQSAVLEHPDSQHVWLGQERIRIELDSCL